MAAIDNISIGILVVKDADCTKKGKTNGKPISENERNINFINIEEHKKFVENIFSVFDPPSPKTIVSDK